MKARAMRLGKIAELKSGSPQFRIKETEHVDAPVYSLYGQAELEEDLSGLDHSAANALKAYPKQIQTSDKVNVLKSGDLVFSLISGKAAIVRPSHNGYLFTQNYVKLLPSALLDSQYLAYLLNENREIKRQLLISQQGSSVMKHTIQQLSDLIIPKLPAINVQEAAGSLYFNQLKLAALKKRVSNLKTMLVLEKIKEALQS